MAGFDNDCVYCDNADFSTAGAGGGSATNGLQTNGQLWIGRTALNAGGTHIDVNTLTAGSGVSITNGPGTITIGLTGGGAVNSITGGPGITITGTAANPIVNSVVFVDTAAATLVVDGGIFATAAGTYPMPATAAQGELIIVFCDTAGAVVLDCPALNFIRIGSIITSSGGTVTSTSIGDSLTLRYRLSSLTWECTSVIGTWVVA